MSSFLEFFQKPAVSAGPNLDRGDLAPMSEQTQPYAIPITRWGREYFEVSTATAYRIVNGADPPPIMARGTRRLVAVGHAAYEEWLERHVTVTKPPKRRADCEAEASP